MFFLLSKLLGFLISPIIWVFILFTWGIFSKKPARKKRLLISSLVILFFFSNGFIFSEFMRAWEVPPVKDSGKLTYGIVLGGMVGFDESMQRPLFYRTSDRFLQALDLWQNGTFDTLIISGGSGRLIYESHKESDILKSYLTEIGFSGEKILVENQSRNTRENALFTALLLEKHRADSSAPVMLITSAFHMRRSVAAFEKAGIHVVAFPVDHYAARGRRFHPDHLLVPQSEVLYNWELLIHEWIGWISYKVAGYI